MAVWVVRCDDYTSPPHKTEERARQALELIEQAGHCHQPHEVKEVER